MGKRKDGELGDPLSIDSTSSSHKKHKKHKKKHKKRKDQGGEDDFVSVVDESPRPSIKLTIKIGGEMLGEKSVTKTEIIPAPATATDTHASDDESIDWEDYADDDVTTTTNTSSIPVLMPGLSALLKKKQEKHESDEESAWLKALEAGELDDNGEIKKEKNPKLLTARQRALVQGRQEKELVQLPSGYKAPEYTEEQLQRRQQRAKKRRDQAHEKREKDKKQTIDRLLKKQETKSKGAGKGKSRRHNVPRVRYHSTARGSTISFPQGAHCPMLQEGPISLPKPRPLCGVPSCKNPKKYNCSKTLVPLCSLECYKRNQLLKEDIFC
ncbi:INO80 complex subunit B-like isoform X2 [Lineus longissimus]|uniref:INO80 complex subunit B-like isoform X2 n=1 Tax=Lineus longissimus TaxID=88925 RepID=UPI00315DA155